MNVVQEKDRYLVDGSPRIRVSRVCDALARLDSDSLVYAGGSWAADRALAINKEVFDGVYPLGADRWCNQTGLTLTDFLVSNEYKQMVSASVAREQQRAADRGTLTNLALDALIEGHASSLDEMADFVNLEIDRNRVEAESLYSEWKAAFDQGLTTKSQRPERGYQASVDDVLPFLDSLLEFWKDSGLYVLESQTFVHDDLVAGTLDYVVDMAGKRMIVDLKTRNASTVRCTDYAQIATYTRLYADGMGLDPSQMKYGGVLICTPEKTVLRFMSQLGYSQGLKDFALALEIVRTRSTAGMFLSASRTKELAS